MTAAFPHPYGAYELKSGSRQRMAIAGAMSATLVTVSVLAGLILGSVLRGASPHPRSPRFRPIEIFFPEPVHAPAIGGTPPVMPRDVQGRIVPVRDEIAPEARAKWESDLAQVHSAIDADGPDKSLAQAVGADPNQAPRRVESPEAPYIEEQPRVLKTVLPRYPDLAREAGIEGKVVLKVKIGVDGRVKEALVVSGVPTLNESALQAVRQYLFRPAYADHRPVEVWVLVPMAFRLQSR